MREYSWIASFSLAVEITIFKLCNDRVVVLDVQPAKLWSTFTSSIPIFAAEELNESLDRRAWW